MKGSKADQYLKMLWEREAASGGSRNEVFHRTLAAALGLNHDAAEDQDFVLEVWLAMWSRDCRDIPAPQRRGHTIYGALRLAVRLHRLVQRTAGEDDRRVLRIRRPASAAEHRNQVLRDREIRREEKDHAIYEAVKKEIARNGRRGAYARVAQRFVGRSGGEMTPQNVGRRYRVWEERLKREDADLGNAEMREAVMTRLLQRREKSRTDE